MGIIGFILLGLIAGTIAKAIMPGDDPGGIIVTALIGIAGAIVGGLIASALDIGDLDDFFDIGTWLIAIAGSLLLLLAYRLIIGRDTGPRPTRTRPGSEQQRGIQRLGIGGSGPREFSCAGRRYGPSEPPAGVRPMIEVVSRRGVCRPPGGSPLLPRRCR